MPFSYHNQGPPETEEDQLSSNLFGDIRTDKGDLHNCFIMTVSPFLENYITRVFTAFFFYGNFLMTFI